MECALLLRKHHNRKLHLDVATYTSYLILPTITTFEDFRTLYWRKPLFWHYLNYGLWTGCPLVSSFICPVFIIVCYLSSLAAGGYQGRPALTISCYKDYVSILHLFYLAPNGSRYRASVTVALFHKQVSMSNF